MSRRSAMGAMGTRAGIGAQNVSLTASIARSVRHA
ncbi:hypothetical protein HEP75_04347 [Xanthomonas sp. SI]|nr:hypothetical protein HEP75_04347 [Xanthomonas sp. SI]